MTLPDPTGTVADLLEPLRDVDHRGVFFEDRFLSWRDHSELALARAEQIRAVLASDRPPHFGVLLSNTTHLSVLLHVAAVTELVLVALNPVRSPGDLAADAALADCGVVLTDTDHRHLVSRLPAETVVIDVDDPVPPHAGRPVPQRPSDLFALVFTSGTSGSPKAVRCTQAKVFGAGRMLADRFTLGTDDTVYVSMPLFHSNAILAGWAVGIAAGGSIALARRFSASRFLDDVRRVGATYANYVGTPLSYILATEARADDADNPLRTVYGNEGHRDDLVAFADRFGVRVVDGYGSTEGGIAIPRTPDTPAAALGRPGPGIEIVREGTDERCDTAVFDASGALANPDEAIGELVNTTGAGGFDGYYRNPGADAERLRGGRYRSGDLAYFDSDGFAYFAGRVGDWMRVGGENLGTRPIAAALREHPSIADSAVYPIADRIGDTVMAAIVTDGGVTADELTAFVRSHPRLTSRQHPAYVRVTEALPRTATFKVLTRQLAAEGLDTRDTVYTLTPSGYRPLHDRKARR